MTPILIVCTGNICRSPLAEGFLRLRLDERLGADAPEVSSTGTIGWEGSPAMPESVEVAAEREVDISAHRARRLEPGHVAAADVVIGMCVEHRDAAGVVTADAGRKVFTLKELVRVLEELPPATPDTALGERIAAASELRRSGFHGIPTDEDVVDPLGMSLETYRAVAWEIDEWSERLATGLYGHSEGASVATDARAGEEQS
ncbi:MAG: low molecular weight phosphatase family protein [Actinomycetota bacterium]